MKPASRLAHWMEIAREAIGGRGGDAGAGTRDEAARRFRALVVDEFKAAAASKPAAPPPAAPTAPHAGALARARPRAKVPPLEWEPPVTTVAQATRPGSEFMRRKIRERYLAVRFPGTPHGEADLRDTAGVVKSARLYFEDGDIDRATELLEFAGDVNPADEAVALAHLEILYLARRARAYRDAAWAHHERFPASGHWTEIVRIGAQLLPGDLLFKGAKPAEDDPSEHFGAWPRVQNWIQAPFDLTGDVLAAEFHAQLRGGVAAPPITAKASGR